MPKGEKENKSNYSEKLEETKNNVSTQIRREFSRETSIMRSLCKVIHISRYHSGMTFSVWQEVEPRPQRLSNWLDSKGKASK